MIRSQTLDRRKIEFSGLGRGGGLGAPSGFCNEIGGLLPMAPCGLLQDHLVAGQFRDCLSKTSILSLNVLEIADLIALQAPVFLPPTVVRHLGHFDRANRVRDRLALRSQHINLT